MEDVESNKVSRGETICARRRLFDGDIFAR